MALVALNLRLPSGDTLKIKALSLFAEASGQVVLAVSSEVGQRAGGVLESGGLGAEVFEVGTLHAQAENIAVSCSDP
jgi:hypothetical protein